VTRAARRWDVVVVGGANWDFLARGRELPKPGGTVRGESFQEAPGGKGANQAVAAARLGARTSIVARVGADARGEMIVDRLISELVDTAHVVRDPRVATGIAVVQVGGDGEKQILTAPGANACLSVDDVREAQSQIADATVLLVQLEASLETVSAAIRIAHDAGTIVVLDPAPAVPLPAELLRLVHLIRPNREEAQVITGVEVRDRQSARTAACKLLDDGVGVAVIQAGSDGDLMVWRGSQRMSFAHSQRTHADRKTHELWLPRIPVDAIDATGAGDAFAAALAVKVALHTPLEEAGRFASAAAALTTTKLGAQAALPTTAEVDSFLRSTALSPIR
jgi:ribokinase